VKKHVNSQSMKVLDELLPKEALRSAGGGKGHRGIEENQEEHEENTRRRLSCFGLFVKEKVVILT